MPARRAPGVYIEEVPSGLRLIAGVDSSTAGFAGETERGPLAPRLITSFSDYQQWYGGFTDHHPLHAAHAFLPYAVRGFFDNGGRKLFIARVASAASTVASCILAGSSGPTTLRAIGPGMWGNEIVVAVKAASRQKAGTASAHWFRIQLLYYRERPAVFVDPTDASQGSNPDLRKPDVLEDFDNLTHDATQPNYAATVINGASRLIEVVSCLSAPVVFGFEAQVRLQHGGPDPYVAPSDSDFIGVANGPPDRRTGIEGLCAIEAVSLLAVPSTSLPAVHDALIDRCESLRDRFAVVDMDDGTDYSCMQPPRDTSFAAAYFPQLLVPALHTPSGATYAPAAGHVAGLMARVDAERGVHRAPANEIVRGIVTRDLADGRTPLRRTLSMREQEVLNPRGINVIRDLRSARRGIRVWGARTMSSDPEYKYVNVRRFVIMLEQSIQRGTQWVVFEPNQPPTWRAVIMSINSFLGSLWRNGALAGQRERDAFFVRCDQSTMTSLDVANGRLVAEVGVALLKPAEFVIIRISQKTAS